MYKNIIKVTLLLGALLILSGCSSNNLPVAQNQSKSLNIVINQIANQLLQSANLKETKLESIAITSFVDLDKFNKTTHFGRMLGESMYNELFKRGFKITEFRGQSAISINANGEYFISRDHTKLKDSFTNKYVLVGTYTMFDNKYMINARIMDNISGAIVATARTSYSNSDCKLSENCIKVPVKKIKPKRIIKITTDSCSKVKCPTNCSPSFCAQI